MSHTVNESSNIIISALNSVPDRHSWGIVMYIYVNQEGKIEYEFCGSYLEFDGSHDTIKHIVENFSFEEIKAGLEHLLTSDKSFAKNFSVTFGEHVDYGTPCARIGKNF